MQNPDGLHADYGFSTNPAARTPPPSGSSSAAGQESYRPVFTPPFVPQAPSYAPTVHQLRTMPYQQYLQTEHWQFVRRAALARAGGRCQLCNSPSRLQVHHRTYERRGAEHDTDVTVLCDNCHGRYHGKLGAPPFAGHYSSSRSRAYKRKARPLINGVGEAIGLLLWLLLIGALVAGAISR